MNHLFVDIIDERTLNTVIDRLGSTLDPAHGALYIGGRGRSDM